MSPDPWQAAAKLLVISGLGLTGLGLLLLVVGKWGRDGRLLPGDIVISRPGFTFYLPVATCVVLSLLLSALLMLVVLFLRR